MTSSLLRAFQCTIQQQHIHPRLTEQTKLPIFGILCDQCTHSAFIEPTRLCNSFSLISCRIIADVGIESAA